jgi:predicted RND superfamily exporter protein
MQNNSNSNSNSNSNLLSRWIAFNFNHPILCAILLFTLTGLSVWQATQLTINSNQLDLISQDSKEVKNLKRVIDMIGGVGYLTIGFRAEDPNLLKSLVDELAVDLAKDPDIREVQHKLDMSFIQERAGLYLKTEDLKTIKDEVMAKIKDEVKRSDPFFFEIKESKPVELNVQKLQGIVEKYRNVGKKRIDDDYYLSTDQKMILMMIKPKWDSNQLEKTGALTQKLRALFAQKEQLGDQPIELLEDATSSLDRKPFSPQNQVIEYGFTGTYQTNYDDSHQIQNSLAPVSSIALIGVGTILLFFFGRSIFSAINVLFATLIGIILTFGFTAIVIGELNMITSILGGILMGLGIDFGIHFLYRLQDELKNHGGDLLIAMEKTLRGAGWASVISALGSCASFFSLMTSDFKGFSQFGLLSAVGIALIGLSIYFWAPTSMFLLYRFSPKLAAKLLGLNITQINAEQLKLESQSQSQSQSQDLNHQPQIQNPKRWLVLSAIIIIVLSVFAPFVPFEYNTRALMVDHIPSVDLQDEIASRFHFASDPVAVYTPDLESAQQLYTFLKKQVDEKNPNYQTIDTVLSIYSFLPDPTQQTENAKILGEWRTEIEKLDSKVLSAIQKAKLPKAYEQYQKEYEDYQKKLSLKMLDVQPFTLKDLPSFYQKSFMHLPETKAENHGYLTLLYSAVDLWDGKNMLKFAQQTKEIKISDGQIYEAAGMPVLFSKLTQTILWDGKFTVFLTSILLLIILWIDLKRLKFVLIALIPLLLGVFAMLGLMVLFSVHLNLMNMVVFPILVGYGVSHGVYFIHRYREGVSPLNALKSVGKAVACSTLTTLAGWSALLFASHKGLQSMGAIACLGMLSTLFVSFALMPSLLTLIKRDQDQ